MIRAEEFGLPSCDGKSTLYCMRWLPEGEVRATLQISHGMIEHIRRYGEFAHHLAEAGIAVYGHDHLGHGYTGREETSLGFFAEQEGSICLLKDLHHMDHRIRKEYPKVPHFMLGHSMGSFLVRRYMTLYHEKLSGVILLGTGDQPLPMVICGKAAVQLIGRIRGSHYQSPLMHQLVLGRYNRRFEPAQTKNDWLSRDEKKVREYEEDPYCSFYFSCGAYGDFFNILMDLKLRRQFDAIPKDLPVYVVAGSEDPVGECGRGPTRVAEQFRRLGLQDVELKLYPEDRHELLNEIDREVVYEELIHWLCAHRRSD